jgi:hypothetical protein
MLPFKVCFICGESMTGFVYYHRDCFNRRPNRFFYKSRTDDTFKYLFAVRDEVSSKKELDQIKIKFRDHFDKHTTLFNPYQPHQTAGSTEENLHKFSDIVIYYYRRKIIWNWFSSNYQGKHPSEFWKFAPYMNWHLFSTQESIPEDVVIRMAHSIEFDNLKPNNHTKKVIQKLHRQINWGRAVRSIHFDKSIFRKFKNNYNLSFEEVLRRIDFSEYELENFIQTEYFHFSTLLTYKRLTPLLLRQIPSEVYANGEINRFLKHQDFPEDLLRHHLSLLNWDELRKTQRKLTPKFIEEFSVHLKTLTRPRKKKKGKPDYIPPLPRETLRPILNRNGLGKMIRRSIEFNDFLKKNGLL